MIVRRHDVLPEVLVLSPSLHEDERGMFLETWNDSRYRDIGITGSFIQDNLARSKQGVLRGLHFQHPTAQGKLVSVVAGAVFDVAVDIRHGSPTFGRHAAVRLDEENRSQIWVPPGFAHGYCALSESADVLYKIDAPYRPEEEYAVAWNDPTLAIDWPIRDPVLSARDKAAPTLDSIAVLPSYRGAE